MLDDPALRQAYPFDPAKAKALLGEAGWQPGADGIRQKGGQRLELVLNAIEYGGGADPTAQLIQASLREVGIDVKIKAQARPPFYEDNYRCTTHGPVMFLRATDPDAPLLALPLLAGRQELQLVLLQEREGRPAPATAGASPIRPSAAPSISPSRLLLDEASRVPLVDELAVWAFRSNVQGTKYNFNAYPVLSDASIRK